MDGALRAVLAVQLFLLLFLVAGTFLDPTNTKAENLLSGRDIAEKVFARDEGKWVTRDLKMEMTDRSGTTRVQETKSMRRYYGNEKRTVIFSSVAICFTRASHAS